MHGVHGLHQGGVRKNEFELVGLEMADEMPLDVGGHLRDLGRQLLRTVFSKDALSCIVSLHQALHRMEFGNSNELHTGR